MPNNSVIVAIDAGGTKSRVVVGDEQQIRDGKFQQKEFGPGNFRQIGVDGVRELAHGIRSHFQISVPAEARVIGGFAGAGTAESHAQVARAFEDAGFTAQRTTITSDASLLLASLKNNGIVLIAGTGGICIGRNGGLDIQTQEGQMRAGGYGYRIDSEASGYYLGRRALDIALKLEDGRIQDPSSLYEIVKRELELTDLKRIAAVIYPSPDSHASAQAKIAALAPVVLQAAADGDKPARRIVYDAVTDMADHVKAVCWKLEVTSTLVGLHGGLFKSPNSNSLIIDPLRHHPYLSGLELSFRTVGVDVGDLDALVEAVKFVLDNEPQ